MEGAPAAMDAMNQQWNRRQVLQRLASVSGRGEAFDGVAGAIPEARPQPAGLGNQIRLGEPVELVSVRNERARA